MSADRDRNAPGPLELVLRDELLQVEAHLLAESTNSSANAGEDLREKIDSLKRAITAVRHEPAVHSSTMSGADQEAPLGTTQARSS